MVAGVNSSLNSLAGRVADLEETAEDHETRIASLEAVNESPFHIVDDEADFDAGIALGKHLLLRGEGNGGEISLTTPKDMEVDGTRVWGYGYEVGNVAHTSKIKFDHPVIPAYGAGNLEGIRIRANDIQIAGLEVQGNDAVSLADASYFAFCLATGVSADRFVLRDVLVHNVNRVVSKTGGDGTITTHDLTLERVRGHTLIGYGVAIERGLNRPRIVGCHFNPKPAGYPTTFPNTKGIYLTADINDAVVEGNTVENCNNEGIELTSTALTGQPSVFHPMERNRIIGNSVRNVSGIGISQGFMTDGIVMGNNVDGAGGIGIESTGGQSSAVHNSQIVGNTVRNIWNGASYCTGISVDRTTGDLVSGNKIEEVASTFAGALPHFYSRGILVFESKEAHVIGNRVRDVDGIGCFVQNNSLDPLDTQHVIQSNNFRVLPTNLKAVYAVYLFQCTAVVQGNTSFAPSAGPQTGTFVANVNAAWVKPGFAWTADVTGSAAFLESNQLILY